MSFHWDIFWFLADIDIACTGWYGQYLILQNLRIRK